MARRFLSLVGVLVALGGIGLFVFVGIQVWRVKAEVNRQARYLAAKAHAAGDATDRAISFVRQVLAEARGKLPFVRPAAGPAGAVSPILRLTARQASQELLGSVERAQGAVLAAADAVVVANAALNVAAAGDHLDELDKLFGLSPEHLSQSRAALVSISSELQNAQGILGATPESLTAEQVRAVNAALDQATDLTDRLSAVVVNARTRVDQAKAEVDRWARWGSYGATGLAVLGGLGQLFMLRFCVRKLVHLPA